MKKGEVLSRRGEPLLIWAAHRTRKKALVKERYSMSLRGTGDMVLL